MSCKIPSEIHWHRNIIRLKTKLAMTGYHTDYRSIGSLWCLTGRFTWLRWQCHDITIAEGIGIWFHWPSRDAVHSWICHRNQLLESDHLKQEIASAILLCTPGSYVNDTNIDIMLGWTTMQHLYQSHLNHNNTILLNQQIIFFTLHQWRFFTSPLGISTIY